MGLTGPHARVLEQRPDVAASLTCKPRLTVGQANVIAPAAGVDHDGMRALVVGPVDDEPVGPDSPISPRAAMSQRAPAPVVSGMGSPM
jgi:hypothetical protein